MFICQSLQQTFPNKESLPFLGWSPMPDCNRQGCMVPVPSHIENTFINMILKSIKAGLGRLTLWRPLWHLSESAGACEGSWSQEEAKIWLESCQAKEREVGWWGWGAIWWDGRRPSCASINWLAMSKTKSMTNKVGVHMVPDINREVCIFFMQTIGDLLFWLQPLKPFQIQMWILKGFLFLRPDSSVVSVASLRKSTLL